MQYLIKNVLSKVTKPNFFVLVLQRYMGALLPVSESYIIIHRDTSLNIIILHNFTIFKFYTYFEKFHPSFSHLRCTITFFPNYIETISASFFCTARFSSFLVVSTLYTNCLTSLSSSLFSPASGRWCGLATSHHRERPSPFSVGVTTYRIWKLNVQRCLHPFHNPHTLVSGVS